MNNNYYQNPIVDDEKYNQNFDCQKIVNDENRKLSNSSTLMNIFNINKGKIASLYVTYYNSKEETFEKIFRGIIENAGDGYVIISDPKTGKWTMVLLQYLNYVIFEENINYI